MSWGSGLEFEAWLKTAAPSVRRLAREFPVGHRIETLGGSRFVIGWTEDDYLLVCPINPMENERDACMSVHSVAAARHFRGRQA